MIPCPWHAGIVTDSLPPTWSMPAHRHTPKTCTQPSWLTWVDTHQSKSKMPTAVCRQLFSQHAPLTKFLFGTHMNLWGVCVCVCVFYTWTDVSIKISQGRRKQKSKKKKKSGKAEGGQVNGRTRSVLLYLWMLRKGGMRKKEEKIFNHVNHRRRHFFISVCLTGSSNNRREIEPKKDCHNCQTNAFLVFTPWHGS